MREASSPFCVYKDPASSGLPGAKVARDSCAHGDSTQTHRGGGRHGYSLQHRVGCLDPPCPSPAAARQREGMQSRRLMMSLQSTNRFLLRLRGSPGWDTIRR